MAAGFGGWIPAFGIWKVSEIRATEMLKYD